MTEREQRLARGREEIAVRVANFKAMQEKFQREREAYFTTTMQNALQECDADATSPERSLRARRSHW